jgi:transcriptional regulator with XRE-family HTH domain
MELRDLVLQWRRRGGYTQESLARELKARGIKFSESLLSHVETGRRNLSRENADGLADVLELSDEERSQLHEARLQMGHVSTDPLIDMVLASIRSLTMAARAYQEGDPSILASVAPTAAMVFSEYLAREANTSPSPELTPQDREAMRGVVGLLLDEHGKWKA